MRLLDYLSILFSSSKIFITLGLFMLILPAWRWTAVQRYKRVLLSSGVPKNEAKQLAREYPLRLRDLTSIVFYSTSRSTTNAL